MKFCSTTLGCKVNQYETQGVESILAARGHINTGLGGGCDVCLINTCAVTAESARKSRQAIRRMKKLNPGAVIAVCGCLSQLDPQAAVALGADLVGGTGDRQGFAMEIEEFIKRKIQVCGKQADGAQAAGKQAGGAQAGGLSPALMENNPNHRRPYFAFEELPPGVASGRTRALLKIQDGCDNHCAYCVIPYARGPARSLPVERAVVHAGRLDEQGFREIVVTGIEISSYGKDLKGNPAFADAIQMISRAAPRSRLRLGSLDPGAITEKFCENLAAIPNLCDHFHLSLQSGCDETLLRMGRKYDTNAVLEAILSLRRRFPDCGITADLIVGFPGETDGEFAQTLKFIKTAMFSGMHIFPFSPRPGTSAAEMPQQVTKIIKRERAHIAAQAARETAHAFRLGQIGKTAEVLFERKRGGFWTGRSRNYLEVTARGGGGKNYVHSLQIASVEDDLIWGEII